MPAALALLFAAVACLALGSSSGYAQNFPAKPIHIGLPPALAKRLQGEFVKAMNDPDARSRLLQGGYEIIGNTPDEFSALIRHETELIGKIVKAAGIKPE